MQIQSVKGENSMAIPEIFPQQPQSLWKNFYHITQLPRPSKFEDKMREHILSFAQNLGLTTNVDEVGNVVVYKPASKDKLGSQPIIIQNHMDMVTDAAPEKVINFHTDPITVIKDGSWLKADRTTLGADNGIGCAAAMALMEATDISHPPLEFLFTVDEETGLKGAWGVDPSLFKSRRLLNLDTEEWGSFYIGCAGGIDYELKGDLSQSKASFKQQKTLKLVVSGFLGGHSGVDIHEQRGNAIKFLTEILWELKEALMLHELRAGKAHNIIPRDAWAIVSLEETQLSSLQTAITKVTQRWMSFQPKNDQNFKADLVSHDLMETGLADQSLAQVLGLLSAFPHGAHKYDLASQRELVALSNNLAKCLFVRGQFYIQTSLRFFDRAECVALEHQIQSLAALMGLKAHKEGEYPSWKPVRENQLLDQMSAVYESLYQKKPKITAIHAGLECGILRDKIGPIDAVSFGPTITGAHSPDERVEVESVAKFWDLLKHVLAKI